MKALRVILIIVGLLTLITSVIGVFLPWTMLTTVWEKFGIEAAAETEGSLLVYMTRAMCMVMAWAGVLFLLGAKDVEKHLCMIRILAVASVCVGLTCIVAGIRISIPAIAYLGDGLFCLIAGGLIWTLSCPMKCQCSPSEGAGD